MNRIEIKTLGTLILVGVLTGCFTEKKLQNQVQAPLQQYDDITEIPVKVGIKTGPQVLATMSTLTGIPSSDNGVQNAYNNVSSGFPVNGDITGTTVAYFKSATILGSEFCRSLVDKERNVPQNSREFFNRINYGTTPSDDDVRSTIGILSQKFWYESSVSSDIQSELVEMSSVIREGDSRSGENVAFTLCTSMLANFKVLVI